MRKNTLLGVIICFVISLSSCGIHSDLESDNTLWVLTEKSLSDGMNYQLEQIAQMFEETHNGVAVRIEILPTDSEQREIYLNQLRVQMLAGKGPDLYLLPTGSIVCEDISAGGDGELSLRYHEIEPLFPDVCHAMYNGVFRNITEYYDNDISLHTENLNKTIMDAGIVDGDRYVLPLRYNMPVIMIDPSTASFQLNEEMTITDLCGYAVANEDIMMAIGLQLPNDYSYFPNLFDYKSGKVLVSQQDIANYLRYYQKIYSMSFSSHQQLIDSNFNEIFSDVPENLLSKWKDKYSFDIDDFCDVTSYVCFGTHWSTNEFPLFISYIPAAVENEAVNQHLNAGLVSMPLRAGNGATVAEITYYGAVGASAKNPELAYSLLREFLTEDYQWDILRPRSYSTNNNIYGATVKEVQNRGMVENSWPVRTKGSVNYLWQSIQYQLERYNNSFREGTKTVKYSFTDIISLTDADMHILSIPIDEVRFPIYLNKDESLMSALEQLNNPDGTPTDVDIDKLAEEVWKTLWWHLAEG